MGRGKNLNVKISIVFLILTIVFNQFTWSFLFHAESFFPLWKSLFFGIIDIVFILSAILFYLNRKQSKYVSSYLKIIFTNSIILFFALVILELFMGNWFRPNKLNQLNIIKNKVISYNLQGLYPWPSETIKYSRDKFGFRGNYPNVNKIDILTIGGSTTDQRYVSDGYTYQDVLQSEFKKNGKDVVVVNAGIDGQSTIGHIKNFDWWFPNIPGLKVKYFLFYVGVNDFYITDNHSFDDLVGETSNSIVSLIQTRSALFYLYRTIEGVVSAHVNGLRHGIGHLYSDFSTDDWVDQPIQSNHEEIMNDRLNAYEQRLNVVCEKVKSFGSTPIFVSQSIRRTYDVIDGRVIGDTTYLDLYDGHPINGVDYYYMSLLLNERTKKVCENNGEIFIDLNQELKFDIKNDFYDWSHNTPDGAAKIGKYLYENLKHIF